MSEEGGRMAVSGENGWVFFDYHLATFGGRPPEGPLRLQVRAVCEGPRADLPIGALSNPPLRLQVRAVCEGRPDWTPHMRSI